MVSPRSPLIIHHHVAMILCDSPAILAETLKELEHLELDYQRIGARAIVAPAQQLERIQAALHERGVYPKTVGQLLRTQESGE